MAIEEYLRTHHLMTREDCLVSCPGTTSSNRLLFGRAVTRGAVRPIGVICGTRRRLYVSRVGAFADRDPEPGRVALLLASGGPLGCQSALEAWAGVPVGGVGPVVAYMRDQSGRHAMWNVPLGELVVTVVRDGRRHEPHRLGEGHVTSAEQALVDAMDERAPFAAGWRVLPVLARVRLDVPLAVSLASAAGTARLGRVGLAIERSGTTLTDADRRCLDAAAARLAGECPPRASLSNARGKRIVDERWRVLVPRERGRR